MLESIMPSLGEPKFLVWVRTSQSHTKFILSATRPCEEWLVMKMCSQSHLRSENFPVEGVELLGRRIAGEIWHRLMISHGKPILIPAIEQ